MQEQKKQVRQSIPAAVKKELRQEVGFGCPIKGCGNPYLEYHHFDPPVNVRAHNEPKGMIALCAQHHKKADGGAYSVEQLHGFKANRENADIVKGELDWLRRELLAVVGGNFYYETLRIIVIDGYEVVTFVRDEDGYLRLNATMLSLNAESRMKITESTWDSIGDPVDLRSPPQGKELEVKYANGDYFYLRFEEVKSFDDLTQRYKADLSRLSQKLSFPLTVVEINLAVAGAGILITPDETSLRGLKMVGTTSVRSSCAITHNSNIKWAQL